MKQGYALVEMLIYIIILVFFTVVLVSGIMLLLRSLTAVRVTRNLADGGSVALERITREVRQATSIDNANSLFDATPGRLKLNTVDSAGNPSTIEFAVSSNVLTVKVGNASAENLLPSHLLVNSLIFRQWATTTAVAIKIEATFSDDRWSSIAPTNFYTSAVLRGSY